MRAPPGRKSSTAKSVALTLVATLVSSCVAAPVVEDEKANLATAPIERRNGDTVGKAEACIAAAPCVKSTGVWLPPDLAAQTAGWGEGFVACKSKLEGCSYVKPEPWVYVLVGVAGAVVGGLSVAGVYEFRDWLKR